MNGDLREKVINFENLYMKLRIFFRQPAGVHGENVLWAVKKVVGSGISVLNDRWMVTLCVTGSLVPVFQINSGFLVLAVFTHSSNNRNQSSFSIKLIAFSLR